MSYLVLARKYRPQTFDDVIGQSHVTRTLKNAVTSGRVAHAILFSGPRGTGKTTIARILAKTLNCSKRDSSAFPEPCNRCRSCLEITSGSAADVFEIDGASNNSVDQIRDLRDNVKYMPVHSPRKIYIIDEVHMLSIAAFNALLKTLEEPPAHVVFMFATTEAHKIPITILSRCQRHDLRRVSLEEITKHLASLSQKEGVDIPCQSLELMAQEAGGSVRDSLSLLDQIMSSAEGAVDHNRVLNILGVVDRKVIFDISSALLDRDVVTLLESIDQVFDRGHDMKKLYSRLIEHFRNLLVLGLGKGAGRLVDLPEHEIEQIRNQLKNVSPHFITGIMDRLFAEESTIRFSSQPKLALEMAFVKILQAEPVLPIDTLIEKLDKLQKTVAETEMQPIRQIPVEPAAPPSHPAGVKEAPSPHQGWIPEEQVKENRPSYGGPAGPPAPAGHGMPGRPVQQTPPAPPGTPRTESGHKQALAAFIPQDPPDISWKKFIGFFKGAYPSMAPLLAKSSLKNLTGKSIEIEITGNKFNIRRIENPRNMDIFKKACLNFFGSGMEIKVHTISETGGSLNDKRKRVEHLKKEAMENPVISNAIKIFDGKILEINTLEENAHERHGKHDETGPEASGKNDETSGRTG